MGFILAQHHDVYGASEQTSHLVGAIHWDGRDLQRIAEAQALRTAPQLGLCTDVVQLVLPDVSCGGSARASTTQSWPCRSPPPRREDEPALTMAVLRLAGRSTPLGQNRTRSAASTDGRACSCAGGTCPVLSGVRAGPSDRSWAKGNARPVMIADGERTVRRWPTPGHGAVLGDSSSGGTRPPPARYSGSRVSGSSVRICRCRTAGRCHLRSDKRRWGRRLPGGDLRSIGSA